MKNANITLTSDELGEVKVVWHMVREHYFRCWVNGVLAGDIYRSDICGLPDHSVPYWFWRIDLKPRGGPDPRSWKPTKWGKAPSNGAAAYTVLALSEAVP